jgi:plasmid stabilization system protein ParE
MKSGSGTVMKYRVLYLPLAGQDISQINDALADYPNKAKRLFIEIEKKIKILEDMPYIWPVYQINTKYRQMVLEDHLLFYTVDENERKVKVYRILYNQMDIPKHVK